MSLNPCFNGIWSASLALLSLALTAIGLNPCFNGIWSASPTLRARARLRTIVLILVLMEYGLRGPILMALSLHSTCLNPCFNGIWSASDH